MKKTVRFALLAIAILALAAGPALAEKGDNKIRFGVQMVSPTGDVSFDDVDERVEIEADSAVGPFFEFERMVTDRAGVFGNLSLQTHDVDAVITDLSPGGLTVSGTVAEIDVMPLEFGVNFYVFQNDSIDFYLGPKLAYVFYGDVEFDPAFLDPGDPGEIPTEDDFAYGANFGLDASFGESGWMFSAGLQYLIMAVETDEGVDSLEVDIDPFVIKVGVGKKF